MPLTPRTRDMLLARKQSVKGSKFVFPGSGKSGHLTTIQHAHEKAIRDAGLESFEFYCWRHTFGTRCAESGMDKFTLARLMGHSSPRVALSRFNVFPKDAPCVLDGAQDSLLVWIIHDTAQLPRTSIQD